MALSGGGYRPEMRNRRLVTGRIKGVEYGMIGEAYWQDELGQVDSV